MNTTSTPWEGAPAPDASLPGRSEAADRSYLSDDVTSEAMASFFGAAARLYGLDPWKQAASLGPLFRLSCQAMRLRGWIGCVAGDRSNTPTLLCFRSLLSHDRFASLILQRQGSSLDQGPPLPEHLVLTYESEERLPASLQAEIRTRGWPLQSWKACPLPLRILSDLSPMQPDSRQLLELELMVRGLQALLEQPDSGAGSSSQGSRQRLQVELAGHAVTISVCWLSRHQSQPSTAASELQGAAVVSDSAEDGGSGQQRGPDAPEAVPAAPSTQGRSGRGATVASRLVDCDGDALKQAYGRVPLALQPKLNSLMAAIEPFVAERLNPEYRQLIQSVLGALARKRPSPLLTGREPSWCAGIVHAVGIVNFLFDRQQSPHCKAPEIYDFFAVSAQTGQAHSKKVRDLLGMHAFHWKWTLPSHWDDFSPIWMLECNGFIQDVRFLPLPLQIDAWQRGLIPYVPAIGREICLGE